MMKHFDSLTYRLMHKLMDAGRTLNIDIPHAVSASYGEDVKGEVVSVQWWSAEGILNVQYQFRDEGDNLRTRDYRIRPLSGPMFDDVYTLKKVDGTMTLVRKPNEEVDEGKSFKPKTFELTMAGETALNTIRKALEKGTRVNFKSVQGITSSISGHLQSLVPKDGEWYARATDTGGWGSVGYLGNRQLNALKLSTSEDAAGNRQLDVTTSEDYKWVDTPQVDEEVNAEEPIWISMTKKLLAAGITVRYLAPNFPDGGDDRAVFNIEVDRTAAGRRMVEIRHTNSAAIPDSIVLVGHKLKFVELKKVDGTWYLINNNQHLSDL